MKLQKNRAIYWMLGIFFFLMILDFTTVIINPLKQYLEANPLYLYTGSFALIILLNIIFGLVLYFIYTKSKWPFWRYNVCNIFVWLSVARMSAIYSNILAYLYPPSLEIAKTITTSHKLTVAVNHSFYWFFLPYILTLLPYFLFKIDHKISIKK